MATIDILILIIFGVAAFFGFTKGFVRQLGSIAGVVAGFIGARLFGSSIGLHFFAKGEDLETASSMSIHMAEVMGSIIVFLVLFVGVFIVARLVKGVVSMAGLGIFDRLGGAVFSVVKWFLAFSMLLNLWLFIAPSSELAARSQLLGGSAMEWILKLFPWLMGLAGGN